MSTKVCKWTREKAALNKADFRDPTRRSHDELPWTISEAEKQRILSFAFDDPIAPVAHSPSVKDSPAAALAVGCSRDVDRESQRRLQKLRHEISLSAPSSGVQNEKSEKLGEILTKNPRPKTERHKSSRRPTQADLTLCHLLLNAVYRDSQQQLGQSTDESGSKSVINRQIYLQNLKDRINSFKECSKPTTDEKKMSEERMKQIKEKTQARNKARIEKARSDNQILKADMKVKAEEEEKRQQKRITQKELRESLDKICAQKRKARVRETQETAEESRRIELSNAMYEESKQEELQKKRKEQMQLLRVARADIDARERFLKEEQDRDKREDARNFEYSIFKRSFGRKMRQFTKDMMRGVNPQLEHCGIHRSSRS